MKSLFALILVSTAALAGDCCTGSCWTTGCCDPRQRCSAQSAVKNYSCVNEKDPTDIMRVIKTNGNLTEGQRKAATTSSGI